MTAVLKKRSELVPLGKTQYSVTGRVWPLSEVSLVQAAQFLSVIQGDEIV